MERINALLFALINASASPSFVVLSFARAAAVGGVYAVAIVPVGLWLIGSTRQRGAVVATLIGVAIAMTVNLLITSLWFHPRPFMVGVGNTFLSHVPETSFPSDHVTLVVSLGLGLIATRSSVLGGILVTVAGLIIGWARVYLGVHWPFDVLGSIAVAVIGAGFAKLVGVELSARLVLMWDGFAHTRKRRGA
jgi:undecaprenyl-diphosphatase